LIHITTLPTPAAGGSHLDRGVTLQMKKWREKRGLSNFELLRAAGKIRPWSERANMTEVYLGPP